MKVQIIEKLLDSLNQREAHEILTKAVKRLFNTIGADDILKEKDGKWFLQDKAISEGNRKGLISEANMFLGSQLWKVLQLDIKYHSNKRMFLESKNEIDMIAGKLWLFTLDSIKTRLESMDKGSAIFNR